MCVRAMCVRAMCVRALCVREMCLRVCVRMSVSVRVLFVRMSVCLFCLCTYMCARACTVSRARVLFVCMSVRVRVAECGWVLRIICVDISCRVLEYDVDLAALNFGMLG